MFCVCVHIDSIFVCVFVLCKLTRVMYAYDIDGDCDSHCLHS